MYDSGIQIATTDMHHLMPVNPAVHGKLAVVYSKWGITTIGHVQPNFHIGYMLVDDIQATPVTVHVPKNTKLLLRTKWGVWLIGLIRTNSQLTHYDLWAKLPKLSPALKNC